jgi:hypothetical protein
MKEGSEARERKKLVQLIGNKASLSVLVTWYLLCRSCTGGCVGPVEADKAEDACCGRSQTAFAVFVKHGNLFSKSAGVDLMTGGSTFWTGAKESQQQWRKGVTTTTARCLELLMHIVMMKKAYLMIPHRIEGRGGKGGFLI